METDRLYRVTKQDETKLIALLTECFMGDPLYQGLIPDQHRREKLLPELFRCDLDEMLDDCEIYAVNENLDGIIVVSDETEPYNPFQYFAEQLYSTLKTNAFLIKDDPSLETFFNFLRGRDYLNSSWTDELVENPPAHHLPGGAPLLSGQGIRQTADERGARLRRPQGIACQPGNPQP